MNDHLDLNHQTHVAPSEEAGDHGREDVIRTGNPVVDEVLSSLDALDRAPLPSHVPVFEAAHDRLRSALADAGDERG